jgi:hypothetical protein
MNIFILDKNPKIAAEMLCDKHVVKMILESAQMLCATHWLAESSAPYKLTHAKHPCNLWLLESIKNYDWLLTHAICLCFEYTKRYHKIHKSQPIIEWCCANKPNLPKKSRTPFPQAMPEEYKDNDSVKAYQQYYLGEKLGFARWRNSEIPKFIESKIPCLRHRL